jgi:hypothetical protein
VITRIIRRMLRGAYVRCVCTDVVRTGGALGACGWGWSAAVQLVLATERLGW